MAGLFRVAPFIAGAALVAFVLTQKAPAPSTATREPERWTPPVFGEHFTDEQRSACDVMIAKAVRLSDLPIERRSSEKVFFRSPILDASFGIDCGRWPGASASYSASNMPPREFFMALGAFGAAVVTAGPSEVEHIAAACQEKALKSRSLETIELSLAGGTLQCNASRDSISYDVVPYTEPRRKSASKDRL